MAERKVEHTPETWRRDGLKIVTGRGIICIAPTPQNGGVFDCEANLNLIKAAPDLLEALREIIDDADQSNGGKGAQLPIVLHIRSIAEAAISRRGVKRGKRQNGIGHG